MISVVVEKKNIGEDGKIIIDEKSDVNHLKNVFRIKIGDIITAVDGEKEYFTEVMDIESKKIKVNIKTVTYML